ncbi:MAG: glutamate/aspartate ABC transporter substrate-binding protein [Betaproteobacteria bacterium]|nr:glutamate/aspartate ABC transporter substrate-binding protein [Betaproteobacteria bacterium]MCL2887097.1 glutamate/aspartate ABC transporter substrate-binding protein [Betaproteobacteria bacterium]
MKRTLIAAGIACAILSAPALAGNTLGKIKASGVIALGHRESSIPFAYYNNQQQVIGYSHEHALKIVEAVKAELRMPNLRVRLVPVTPTTRMGLLQNGTVDIECGSTTNNAERRKQVAFSNSIFISGIRLMTRKDSGIKDFPDLADKSVVTSANTTSEVLLRKMNDEKRMQMNIVSSKDHGHAFQMLETGRAVAFVMDDALLYGEMSQARRSSDWLVTGTPQSREAYGCMLRKDDPAFKKVVDAAIAELQTSGEAERIYNKWFLNTIPPNGISLRMPLSDDMRALFAAPNDKGFD